jgi:hypothetical protein
MSGSSWSHVAKPEPAAVAVSAVSTGIEYRSYDRPLAEGEAGIAVAAVVRAGQGANDSGPPAIAPQYQNYVIIHSSDAPHGRFLTAQGLPDVPYFGVIGTLGPGDPIDLYRMTLDAGTAGLQLALQAQQVSASAPLQLWVFDGSGRVLATWSPGEATGGATFSVSLAGLPTGSPIYLGISGASDPWGSSPGAVDYQLWVTRLSATDGQQTASAGATTPLSSPLAPGLSAPAATIASQGAIVSATGALATVASSNLINPDAGPPVAVGSLLTRSAGASGGVMADGEPAPAVLQPLAAAGDLERGDRYFDTNVQVDRPVNETADPDCPQREAHVLVASAAQGGFPLIGAPAVGNWRETARVLPPTAEEMTGPACSTSGTPNIESYASTQIGADVVAATATGPEGQTGWRRFQISLSWGMGLATVLTLNTVFCDPLGGFDYLASRHDSDPAKARRRPLPV